MTDARTAAPVMEDGGSPAGDHAASEASARPAAQWAPTLKALADENRLTLALLIARRPRTVKDLERATGMSQTLVSYHLKPLRDHGLVSVTPVGRSNRYELCCDEVVDLVAGLAHLADGAATAS